MKVVIALAFLVIIGALAWAGVRMLRSSPDDDPSSAAAWRARWHCASRLSVALFLFILVAWHSGWIQPTGVPVTLEGQNAALRAALSGARRQNQYTMMYRPSHTTSTKCQYHAAPSSRSGAAA